MDSRAADEVQLLRGWGLGPASIVVDLGCGTGQFALAVAPVGGRVVAVDVSPAMRARLERKCEAAALDNIHIVAAGFLKLRLRRRVRRQVCPSRRRSWTAIADGSATIG